MSFGPNISFGFGANGAAAGPSPVVAANNGLSLSGTTVQLGQAVGAVGNPAILLSDREIPMGGFNLFVNGAGNLVVGAATSTGAKVGIVNTSDHVALFTQFHSTRVTSTAIWSVVSSASAPLFQFRMNLTGTALFFGNASGAVSTGANNTGIGFNSLATNTTGTNNVAIGVGALAANQNGGFSVAIGDNALSVLVSGTLNTVVGVSGMSGVTTAVNCTSVGGSALLLTNGTGNTALGLNAGRRSIAGVGTGNDNVIIGVNAMQQGSFTDSNILVGARVCRANNLGANNIVIGTDGNILLAGGTNIVAIGSGMTVNVSNVVAIGLATQNVIIGQTVVNADTGHKLHVTGAGKFTGSLEAGAPAGGAGVWQLGKIVVGAVVLDATQSIEVVIDAVPYKLALAV